MLDHLWSGFILIGLLFLSDQHPPWILISLLGALFDTLASKARRPFFV